MMSQTMMLKSYQSLVKHEGYSKFPYTDSLGKTTIGIGYNLSDRGISDDWIKKQFDSDVSYFYSQLCKFGWYNILNEDRKIVLLDMSFMGWQHFLKLERMISALASENYEKAADEMLDSLWAKQVKYRAVELAEAMRSGIYNIET